MRVRIKHFIGNYVSTKPTAFSTCDTSYWHVTGGGQIRFQIQTSTGVSVATA